MTGRRGPSNALLMAAGLTPVLESRGRAEFALCSECGSDLHHTIGGYGQTLEACTNDHCVNAAPHHPIPTPEQGARPRLGHRRGPT